MPKLNLDRSKQYATDYSTDGGKTWVAESSGWCSAGVEMDVSHAEEHGNSVDVRGAAVFIRDPDGITRWTPTT